MIAPLALSSFLFLAPGAEPPAGETIHLEKAAPPVPERNIRRRFGEKTVLEIPGDAGRNPVSYRLACGFRAWAGGADGISTHPATDSLAAAFEAARADIALLEKLESARVESLSSDNPDIRLPGRKIGNFLANLRAFTNPDLAHLEGFVLLTECEKALGREPSSLPDVIRASVARTLEEAAAADGTGPSPKRLPASRRHRKPPQPDMASWPAVNLRAGAGRSEFAPGFLSNFTFQWRSFQIGVKGDRVLGPEEYPGGSAKITLWIPSTDDDWLVYRATVSLEKPPVAAPPPMDEGWAPDPGYYYYHHERRFPDKYPAPESFSATTYDSDCIWGRNLPRPFFGGPRPGLTGWIYRNDGPWYMLYSFDLCNIPNHLPMMTLGIQDAWYAEITYGGQTAHARFVWPAGSEATILSVYRGYALEQFWQTYPKIYEDERLRIESAGDDRFLRDFAVPLLNADQPLFEKFKCWNGRPPDIGKEAPKVQIAFYRALARVTFIYERLDELRLRYLADIVEGREPKPPEINVQKKPTAPTLPQLDAEPLLDLDEEVF